MSPVQTVQSANSFSTPRGSADKVYESNTKRIKNFLSDESGVNIVNSSSSSASENLQSGVNRKIHVGYNGKRAVQQIDMTTGQILKTFSGIRIAAAKTGISSTCFYLLN